MQRVPQLLFVILYLFLGFSPNGHAILVEHSLPQAGVLTKDTNAFMDPDVDYVNFTGRVSDRDDAQRVFKVHVENNNTKFFRAGDSVYFKVQNHKSDGRCKGFVRNVEDFYFSLYVESLTPCWKDEEYFRRGTVLVFDSEVLAQRVLEASKFRQTLIIRKEDFLKQLNGINQYLWTFDQQKAKVAAGYDAQINEIERAKRKALDDLIQFKQEQLTLQTELMKRLNELDDSLKFYRVERQELMVDRWNMDHDNALPVGQRPQLLKKE